MKNSFWEEKSFLTHPNRYIMSNVHLEFKIENEIKFEKPKISKILRGTIGKDKLGRVLARKWKFWWLGGRQLSKNP